MSKVEFTLDWNDIHKVLSQSLQGKATEVLEDGRESYMQSFISFTDKNGEEVKVENCQILFKKVV